MIHRKPCIQPLKIGAIIMTNDIKNAKKEYYSKNYEKSLKIYNKLFNEEPESFTIFDLISYCWAIYQVHIKNFINEHEFFKSAEFITQLIPQSDLTKSNTCPYTFSVFKILNFLYNQKEYYNMFEWLEKLNPNLLDENKSNFKGKITRSRKEKFYHYSSKAYFECEEWEDCIKISIEALNSVKNFTNNGEIWHKWRIAKSLKQLNQNKEALKYLNDVVELRKDWYVKKEMAENYLKLNDTKNALKYLAEAVMTSESSSKKVNLYYLIYEVLNESQPEIAFKHAELYYLLKQENNAYIKDDILELDIHEDELDKVELEKEIWRCWYDFKYEGKNLEYGTICEISDNNQFGYIISNNLESVYFNKSDFEGNHIKEGMYVSFFTEKCFDKSLNKELVKAVDIKEE